MRGSPGGRLLAHGLGDAGDLPVELPVVLFLAAGLVVLAAALADRADRADRAERVDRRHPAEAARPRDAARPLPRLTAFADARATRAALRAVALLGYLVVVASAMLGPAPASSNPAPRTFFVLFLGLLVPVSILLGPVWRVANPFRTMAAGLARIAGDPEQRAVSPLPAGIGVWPAVAQLVVVIVAERSASASAGGVLLLVLGLTAVQLLAANRYGPAWFRHGDPFEVVAETFASLAPVGRGDGGVLVRRRVRAAAPRLPLRAGLPALLGILIAGHLTDFLLDTPTWHAWRAPLSAAGQVAIDTATLAAVAPCAVAAIALTTRAAARRPLLAAFVPVAAGYALAHDLGELLVEGQLAIIQLSDPLGRGWDLLAVGGRYVPAEPVPPSLAALLVVTALVAGHVLGVAVADEGMDDRQHGRVRAALQLPLRLVLVCSVAVAVGLRLVVG